MPGWGIAAAIIGVVVVVGAAAVVLAAVVGSAFGSAIEEFDSAWADESADYACTSAGDVLHSLPTAPNAADAIFIRRSLDYALFDAQDAWDSDPAYEDLYDALDAAASEAAVVADLPMDRTAWTSQQASAADRAWGRLAGHRDRVAAECATVPSFGPFGENPEDDEFV